MTMAIEKPEEIIVAAVASNGVIGAKGRIPWHCPEDLRLFRALTLGGTVIMGRRTYHSIGHPLAGRRNIVISSTLSETPGIILPPTFDAAVALALSFLAPIYYCGGAQIYARALERADAIYLSRMKANAEGDVFFPDIDPLVWQVVQEEDFADFVHLRYRRNSAEHGIAGSG
ncbi:MAG: dihydrofolate reductase [Desulfuromonadales bacterium]|nr:dihydrofolate reductase [Desulfuromonadales bacterium]